MATEIICDVGYAKSLDKKRCIKIPEHAYAVNSSTDVWLCDDGYQEVGNKCTLINFTEKPLKNISANNINSLTTNNETILDKEEKPEGNFTSVNLSEKEIKSNTPKSASNLTTESLNVDKKQIVDKNQPKFNKNNITIKPIKLFFTQLLRKLINWFK